MEMQRRLNENELENANGGTERNYESQKFHTCDIVETTYPEGDAYHIVYILGLLCADDGQILYYTVPLGREYEKKEKMIPQSMILSRAQII